MTFKRGDHICSIYSTTDDLTQEAASFLAEGLRCHERCWYVGHGFEIDSIDEGLRRLESTSLPRPTGVR